MVKIIQYSPPLYAVNINYTHMAGLQLTELRTLPRTLSQNVPVVADTDIVTLTPDIHNNTVSFFTIEMTPQAAGKLYIVTEDGYEEYLTDPDNDWPAKKVIIATYIVAAGTNVGLRYSSDTTASTLIVTEGSGVY